MTKKEIEKLEKEVAMQMGYDNIEGALTFGEWSKVDPELADKFVEYTSSCMVKEMYGQ